MWMKTLSCVMVMLLAIPLVMSIEECKRQQEPKDIPCIIYSTWRPLDCAAYNITVYNESDNLVQIVPWYNLTTVCNATFNLTKEGTYVYNSSIESGVIEVKVEDNMMSLGVVIFLIMINIAIFSLPFFIRFNEVEMWHKVISKIIYIFGLGALAFNLTIIVKLADNAGLGITNQLWLYEQTILWIIYTSMILLMLNVIVASFKTMKIQDTKRRMGEE